MDRNWSKVATPEDYEDIPRLPTRAEELEYLDNLEREFKHQTQLDSSFPPDPSRKYQIDSYHNSENLGKQKKISMLGIAALYAPLSLWLSNRFFAKKSPLGVPYRAYPHQHYFRFWSFFLFYETVFTWFTYYGTLDKETVEKVRWPLHIQAPRKL